MNTNKKFNFHKQNSQRAKPQYIQYPGEESLLAQSQTELLAHSHTHTRAHMHAIYRDYDK